MRLCEMGFPRDHVAAALQANGGNEDAALNSLLAGPVNNPGGAAPAAAAAGGVAGAAGGVDAAATGAPEKPAKPSGLFGRMWGSK